MGNTVLAAAILGYVTRSWILCKGKLRRTDKLPFAALYQAVSRSETEKNSSASLFNEQCLWFHYPGTFQFHTTVPAHFKFLKHALLTGLTFFAPSFSFPLMEEIPDERKDTVYTTVRLKHQECEMVEADDTAASTTNILGENHVSPLHRP